MLFCLPLLNKFFYHHIIVTFIMEILRACRTNELVNILPSDIEDHESVIVINVSKTKNYTNRKFILIDDDDLGAAR